MSWHKGRVDDLWISFKLILIASRANRIRRWQGDRDCLPHWKRRLCYQGAVRDERMVYNPKILHLTMQKKKDQGIETEREGKNKLPSGKMPKKKINCYFSTGTQTSLFSKSCHMEEGEEQFQFRPWCTSTCGFRLKLLETSSILLQAFLFVFQKF